MHEARRDRWDSGSAGQREQLLNYMEQRGYEFVGQGNYAAVFRKPGRRALIKVYGTALTFANSSHYNPLVFYRMAKSINNRHVPRFGTPRQLRVGTTAYLAIPTEELQEYPADDRIAELLPTLLKNPLEQVLQNNRAAQKLSGLDLSQFQDLHQTYRRICDYLDCDSLESGNVLWRGNTPVINDPWFRA